MYRLYDVGNNTWQIHTRDFGAKEGSFRQITQFMVFELGFEWSEIEFAVETMLQYDHNGADFGVFKRFIFSFNKEKKNVA